MTDRERRIGSTAWRLLPRSPASTGDQETLKPPWLVTAGPHMSLPKMGSMPWAAPRGNVFALLRLQRVRLVRP